MIEIIEPADPRADLNALAALEAITFRNPWTRQMLRVEFEEVEAAVAYVVRTEAHSVAAYCAGRVLGEELHVRNFAVHRIHADEASARGCWLRSSAGLPSRVRCAPRWWSARRTSRRDGCTNRRGFRSETAGRGTTRARRRMP